MRLLKNYLSTLGFIGIALWIILDLSGFHGREIQARWYFDWFGREVVVTIRMLLLALAVLYALVLIPYYRRYPWIHSTAFVFLQGVYFSMLRLLRRPRSRYGLSPGARQAARALLLKFVFAPLMVNWCLDHFGNLGGSLEHLLASIKAGVSGLQLFDGSLFWACFQLILFIDTFLFTIGYIVELPALRNRIRSVDPTFLGWFVCLACYPPFNEYTGQVLAWQSSDFPQFSSLPGEWPQGAKDTIHVVANVCLLVSLAIFSWASVALGFKASNLTNRGIVSQGPYSVVRHPAYAAKNLAWWIGAVPTIYLVFLQDTVTQGVFAILATLGWTTIYVLRAITEERHLLMGNNGYAEYKARVRWRFIPGVF